MINNIAKQLALHYFRQCDIKKFYKALKLEIFYKLEGIRSDIFISYCNALERWRNINRLTNTNSVKDIEKILKEIEFSINDEFFIDNMSKYFNRDKLKKFKKIFFYYIRRL